MKISAFFWTQFAGAFNDNFYKNALILWITFSAPGLDGGLRSTLVILCSAVFILPFFLFSATAGWLADRYPKDRVIRWTKAAEIVIMGAGAVGFALGSIPALILVLFLMGAQSAWFGPAKYGIVPELAHEEDLLRANGLVAMGTFVAILTGTLFGGIAGSLPDGPATTGLAVVLIALFGWVASLRIPRLEAKAPVLIRRGGIWRETRIRLHEIRRSQRIFPLLVAISWFWFHVAFVLQLLPIQVMASGGSWILPKTVAWLAEDRGGSGSLVTLSLLLFSGGIGLGSMISGRRRTRHIETASSVTALILLAASAILLPLADGVIWLTLGFLALSGIAAGLYSVPLYSAIQSAAPPEERARFFAGGNILDAGFMVGASLLMQALEFVAIEPVERFAVLGLLDLLFLLLWLWPRSDLVQRYLLRFSQDTRRELIGRPEHACIFTCPATFSRATLASLALSFPCLPAGYDGKGHSPEDTASLVANGTSVVHTEGSPLPAGTLRYRVTLDGKFFVCTLDA